ncbi:MAG: helix-turn-helix domain-containing protein [Pseudomonadota bacterium]|nr:helix-turn-helix domain-containing protein [Pseudomonadota bacterium]
MKRTELEVSDQLGRGLLSTMRSLLVLGQLMTESTGERQIIELAITAVPSLACCRVVAHELAGSLDLRGSATGYGLEGGLVAVDGAAWGWGYPLGNPRGRFGVLVVAADEEPSWEEQFLLRALAQQTGAALANCRLHAQELAAAEQLSEVNERLRASLGALERSIEIHDRLTAVAVSGEGRGGIARAVHELTGLSVAIEDRYGNLEAWAGPERPDTYPKESTRRREALLRRAGESDRPIREQGSLIALAHPQGDILGVISLIDPSGLAGDHDIMALEHGATILAMELARIRSLAEGELRVRRDLVDELLNGTEEESALARAGALGYDLQRPHRVVLVESGRLGVGVDRLFQAVRIAARDEGAGSLLVARGLQIVLLADRPVEWESLRQAVMRCLGGAQVRVAVGEDCSTVAGFPQSFGQARIVLQLMKSAEWMDQAVRFDDLGIYRLLAGKGDLPEVDRFIQRWIGSLIDYDEKRNAELVRTLMLYLCNGGNYQATAEALFVHRNTLKYRLQRIRQISGLDLSDPEISFNLQLATRAWQTTIALRGLHP